jgi:signal transduction histidine kinase
MALGGCGRDAGGVRYPTLRPKPSLTLAVLMGHTPEFLLLGGLTAGLAVAWLRSGRRGLDQRARVIELAWCAALLAVGVAVMVTTPYIGSYPVSLAFPLAAGLLVVLRPQLAARLVPAALILLGLWGFVVARRFDFSPWHGGQYAFLASYYWGSWLILPLAYALILVGGGLAWWQARRGEPGGRLIVGGLADQERPSGWLLLPIACLLADLTFSGAWFGSAPQDILVTLAVLAAAFWFIRRHPVLATRLASPALVIVGLIGVAAVWWSVTRPQFGAFSSTSPVFIDGLVDVSRNSTAEVAFDQSLAFVAIGLALAIPSKPYRELLRRVQRLSETRAVAVDTAAADLRRLERDLHDGAQARLVALGMNLRAAERLIPTSPEAATALVVEAREMSARALAELRELVRGMHPPVLADRGLADALRSLALDAPLRIETDIDLPGRLPAPIETACYFAVAELLTNAAKHSGAREGRLSAAHRDGKLRITVTDLGLGGADPARGTGLAGLEKRLAAFDGIVAVSSPVGGPTIVVLEVPCASSSPKTSSC